MEFLVTYNGAAKPMSVPGSKAVIGRKSRSHGSAPDLCLRPDRTVSRRHCIVWAEDGNYWVEDLGSTLGTFVNGLRRHSKWKISFGDRIDIGKTTLQLVPSTLEEISGEAGQ